MSLVSFHTPWKHEKSWFSDVFRSYRKRPMAWNRLIQLQFKWKWKYLQKILTQFRPNKVLLWICIGFCKRLFRRLPIDWDYFGPSLNTTERVRCFHGTLEWIATKAAILHYNLTHWKMVFEPIWTQLLLQKMYFMRDWGLICSSRFWLIIPLQQFKKRYLLEWLLFY